MPRSLATAAALGLARSDFGDPHSEHCAPDHEGADAEGDGEELDVFGHKGLLWCYQTGLAAYGFRPQDQFRIFWVSNNDARPQYLHEQHIILLYLPLDS